MAQVVECLPSKHEALSLNSILLPTPKKEILTVVWVLNVLEAWFAREVLLGSGETIKRWGLVGGLLVTGACPQKGLWDPSLSVCPSLPLSPSYPSLLLSPSLLKM
jgi:hypothetical protein